MKKLTARIITLTATILLYLLPAHSMDYFHHGSRASFNKEYNRDNSIFLLSQEIWDTIICCYQKSGAHHIGSLRNTIKVLMKLSITCTQFNSFLTHETISNFCRPYSSDTKARLLGELVDIMFYAHTLESIDYTTYRLPISILVHDHDRKLLKIQAPFLLYEALCHDDIDMVKKLLTYNISLNIYEPTDNELPLFFYAKSLDMLQLFIEQRIDMRQTIDEYQNVLWQIVQNNYPSELMAFYLDYGINTTQFHPLDGSTLLHQFALGENIDDIENYISLGNLLLNATPSMVNQLCYEGLSPLYLAKYWRNNSEKELTKAIIRLLKIYNGRVIPPKPLSELEILYNGIKSTLHKYFEKK